MAKLHRERALRERRLEKQARKEARRLAAAAQPARTSEKQGPELSGDAG